MATAPLVSVIVPCFRQAHFLPEALASVFAQTHPAVEAVVVNDGSDDDTDAVARGYGSRIVYVSQKNAGLPAARNAGIEAASGKYLLCLDADDLLHERAIEWLVAAADGRDDVLAVCGWRKFSGSPANAIDRDFVIAPGGAFPRLIHANLAPPNAHLCSRATANAVGRFETGLRSCEDWDLWLRLALAGAEFVAVPHVGAFYRQTPGSMSTNHERMLVTRTEVLLRTHAGFARKPELLARWGTELAAAALRVRRRLRVQRVRPDLVAALTAVLGDLARAGFPAPLGGKESLLARVVGREFADRLVLAYYRRFDRPTYRELQMGHV
jgi:glycosyltransferase involved in cell wall biosynthesis